MRTSLSRERLLSGIEVLVVDDDPRLLDVYERMVLGMGGTCGLARDGVEAIARCRERPWALVLMDLDMPVVDGVTAIAAICEEADQPPTFIAITSLADAEVRERSLAAGAAVCLQKPLRPEQVAEAVSEHLHGLGRPRRSPDLPTTDGDARALDPDQLRATLDLMGDDPAARSTMRQLAAAFRRECPALIQACHEAIVDGDRPQAVAAIAHTLSSRSAALGLAAARTHAATLESAAREDRLGDLDAIDLLTRFDIAQAQGLPGALTFIDKGHDHEPH